MTATTVEVRFDAPIGTISPRLYGHLAEHLGRCCYDGLWSTDESSGQFRGDVVEALHGLLVPLLRWPGGCYADHYHWRDGIRPVEERPRHLVELLATLGDNEKLVDHLSIHKYWWSGGPQTDFGEDEYAAVANNVHAPDRLVPQACTILGNAREGWRIDLPPIRFAPFRCVEDSRPAEPDTGER